MYHVLVSAWDNVQAGGEHDQCLSGEIWPHFLSRRTFDMICGLPSAPVALDEITHEEIRARLEKARDMFMCPLPYILVCVCSLSPGLVFT